MFINTVPKVKIAESLGSISYLFGYKTGFHLSRMTTNNLISSMKFAIMRVLPFLNNPKDLDPSYKDGSRFLGLVWNEKTLSYN